MTVRGDEFRGRPVVKIRDKAGVVMWKAQEFQYPKQLTGVRGGKCPFKIQVTKDNVLPVSMCVLKTKAEMSDRSCA
jgi:hypothetical protein